MILISTKFDKKIYFCQIYDKQQRLISSYFLNKMIYIPYNIFFNYSYFFGFLLLEIKLVKSFLAVYFKQLFNLKKNIYTSTLQLRGLGHKIYFYKTSLYFLLGYSHIIKVNLPKDIKIQVSGNSTLTIEGKHFSTLKRISSLIQNLKIPDIYKGKGISFKDKVLNLKSSNKKSKK